MNNYRTKGTSDTAVHFSFLDTWEKSCFFQNHIVNETNFHLKYILDWMLIIYTSHDFLKLWWILSP